MLPLIGITCDVIDVPQPAPVRHRAVQSLTYAEALRRAGGFPVFLPPDPDRAGEHVERCDGIVISGGPDIDTTAMGIPVHPKATVMHPMRQKYEFALLAAIDARPHRPLLGVCLGMQLIGVHRGAPLIQHLPDQLGDAAAVHEKDNHHVVHPIGMQDTPGGPLTEGVGASNHHQAIGECPALRVIARSPDGVIEAVDDPARPFYLGVQWHPERTSNDPMGVGIFRRLVEACRKA